MALLVACSSDGASVADESSAPDSGSSSGDVTPSTTAVADSSETSADATVGSTTGATTDKSTAADDATSSGTDGDTESSGSSDGTTGEPADPEVTMRLAFPAETGLGYAEIVDGEPAPVTVHPMDNAVSSLEASADAPWLMVDTYDGDTYAAYVGEVLGEPQVVMPASFAIYDHRFSLAHARLDVYGYDDGSETRSLWSCALDDDVVAAPVQILESDALADIRSVYFGTQWAALEIGPAGNNMPDDVYLMPMDDLQADNLVQLTDLGNGYVESLRLSPSEGHAYFLLRITTVDGPRWLLHRVPTTGAMPAEAELIHDLTETSSLAGFQPGSDGFVYRGESDDDVSTPPQGDLYFVADDGAGGSLPAVLLNTVTDRSAVFLPEYFASDGAALIYTALEGTPYRQLYHVALAADVPSPPQIVSVAEEHTVTAATFDRVDEWVYFVQSAAVGDVQHLYRSRVASGVPELPQRIDDEAAADQRIYAPTVSPDGTNVFYFVAAAGSFDVWIADIAGDEPGDPALFHGEIGQSAAGPAMWSLDSRHVAYQLGDPPFHDSPTLVISDTLALGSYVEIAALADTLNPAHVELSATAALGR